MDTRDPYIKGLKIKHKMRASGSPLCYYILLMLLFPPDFPLHAVWLHALYPTNLPFASLVRFQLAFTPAFAHG